jgi:hypothetical protein
MFIDECFYQDDLTHPSVSVDCCNFVLAWGKMAQIGEYFVTFLGKIFIKFDELTLSDWGVFETFWSASTSTQVAFTFFG